jgi:hypothetical protein
MMGQSMSQLPIQVRFTWVDEIEKWLPGLPPGSIHVCDAGHLLDCSFTLELIAGLEKSSPARSAMGQLRLAYRTQFTILVLS